MKTEHQGDLFGGVARQCTRCGAGFTIDRRQGRPAVYCSPVCSEAAAQDQKTKWQREQTALLNAARPPVVCLTCGEPVPQRGRPGRFARFCSDDCRRRGIAARTASRAAERFKT